MTPVLLTAVRKSPLADRAVISTRPPSARIRPPFSARAFTAPSSTFTFSRPSPATSRVMARPAASDTAPSLAEITP